MDTWNLGIGLSGELLLARVGRWGTGIVTEGTLGLSLDSCPDGTGLSLSSVWRLL